MTIKIGIYGCSVAETDRMLRYASFVDKRYEVTCFIDSHTAGEWHGLPRVKVEEAGSYNLDFVLTPVHKPWSLTALYLLEKYDQTPIPYFPNLDWNFTSEKYRLAYKPIPKVAHSAIKYMLYEMEFGKEPLTRNPHQFADIFLRTFDSDPSIEPDYQYFCVVRDPVDRLISGYRFLRDELGLFTEYPDNINWFVDNLDKLYLSDYMVTNHLAPQWMFTGRDLARYDDVINLRQLPDFINSCAAIRESGVTLKRINERHAKKDSTTDKLSTDSITRLQEFYRDDYELLGGHFQS